MRTHKGQVISMQICTCKVCVSVCVRVLSPDLSVWDVFFLHAHWLFPLTVLMFPQRPVRGVAKRDLHVQTVTTSTLTPRVTTADRYWAQRPVCVLGRRVGNYNLNYICIIFTFSHLVLDWMTWERLRGWQEYIKIGVAANKISNKRHPH